MKKRFKSIKEQPETFTPGITKGMVREHAYRIFRDRLPNESLTLEDWVLAEKDLVQTSDADGLLKR
ncbi:MAG: hypothetical protein JWR26_1544 [Pedosphaera sp.]|nr:hypothetical protein [Pedosphaera sp.]